MAALASAAAVVALLLMHLSSPVLSAADEVNRSRIVEVDVGVVASDHVLCSDIGVNVLKSGGNAVDSAVATAFCEGIANPAASGIGGGDFMLVRFANGHSEAFDFREVAPLGASEILNILAAFKNMDAIKGDLGVHHMVEAFKHTYAVRSNLGDPAFVNITGVFADMISADFAATLQKTISDNTTFGPDHYGGKYNPLGQEDEHGTSHISIVDQDRNAVSMTCTINYPFGAKSVSEKTGIILNNEMDDFGTPQETANGPPAVPNFIKPKKRPLSTMSPTILLKDGQLRVVVGGSGGIKILTTVAQVLLNLIVGVDPLSAVMQPRLHHQFLPDKVTYENYTTVTDDYILYPQSTRQSLIEKGHILESGSSGAVSQLIIHHLTTPANLNGRIPKNKKVFFGKLVGVSDVRKDAYPAGY